MTKSQEYIQLKAFARQDGLIMGLLWSMAFACFVGSVGSTSSSSAMLSLLFQLTLIASPFVVARMVRRYRDNIIGGTISFRRGYGYSMMVFLDATLILAIIVWAYIEFLDNGRLMNGIMQTFHAEEMQPMLQAYGLKQTEIDSELQALSETRTVDLLFSLIWTNLIVGFIVSWFVALVSKRTRRQQQ